MKTYHYSDLRQVVFRCDAESILEADALCAAAAFKPTALVCGIGWNLIAYDSSKATMLVVLTDSKRCVEGSVRTDCGVVGKAQVETLGLPPAGVARSLYDRYRYNPDVALFLEPRVANGARYLLKSKAVGNQLTFAIHTKEA